MPEVDDNDLPPWLIERHRNTTHHILRTAFGPAYPQGSNVTIPLIDRIRVVLRDAEAPMTVDQIQGYLPSGTNVDVVHTLCGERKRAGEFLAETVEGKLAYRLAPPPPKLEQVVADATATLETAEPVADVAASVKPVRPNAVAGKAATAAANGAPTPDPQPSPEMQLLGFIRGTSALLDETLERAIGMALNPAVVAHFARASKAMHSGVLMLLGAPE
ncbi:hypothetical protein [Luteibacter sp.]|jgi:hypothetical protein|uniref:hypothetical protein n=1 Tax=Luteibacter sp. TaxID=1886636 RepID=UPI002F429844